LIFLILHRLENKIKTYEMGITHSLDETQSDFDPDQGYVPRKLREVDTHYHESKYQYIVGDGKVLKFCTDKWSLEQVPLHESVKIGDHSAVVLMANRRSFLVTGGNDDYKEYYKSNYLFETNNLESPVILDELPYSVSSHQMVDVHSRKTYILGGVSNEIPQNMPKTPFKLKETKEAHGYILPYIIVSIRNGPYQVVPGVCMTPRCDFQTVLTRSKIIIFGGIGANGKCSTGIEIFDTVNNTVTKASYRLLLGVSGCRLAWHGDDVLLIGGQRLNKRSNGVVKIDFKE
jgi:hypothetical protein